MTIAGMESLVAESPSDEVTYHRIADPWTLLILINSTSVRVARASNEFKEGRSSKVNTNTSK